MSIENENDLIALRKIGRIVARCLQYMGSKLEPGITTLELDQVGHAFLEKHGAPLFQGNRTFSFNRSPRGF